MGDHFESPKQVYLKLLEVSSNEEKSPELLEYEESVMECMLEQIQHMETNIRRCKGSSLMNSFSTEQHQSEIDRLQYVVNSYLRIRIQKIEKNCTSLIKLLKSDPRRAGKLMSVGEIKYLDGYFMNVEKHLSETVLGKMNIPIQDAAHTFSLLQLPQNERQLFDSWYVFVKALKQTEVIVDSEDGEHESVQLQPGSIHFLPYSAVRHCILSSNGSIALV